MDSYKVLRWLVLLQFTGMQWEDVFLQGFKAACLFTLYRYAVRGYVGTITFVWKLPAELSQSTWVTKCNAVVEQLKPRIPQYHTRQM